jgi:hypothetical protein
MQRKLYPLPGELQIHHGSATTETMRVNVYDENSRLARKLLGDRNPWRVRITRKKLFQPISKLRARFGSPSAPVYT